MFKCPKSRLLMKIVIWQDLITAHRVEKNFKIVKRSCSLNRYYILSSYTSFHGFSSFFIVFQFFGNILDGKLNYSHIFSILKICKDMIWTVLSFYSKFLNEILKFGSLWCIAQLPGRLYSPSDKCEKLSHHFLLHFSISMGSYDHHVKYQCVFP